jgi:hypothetical protein
MQRLDVSDAVRPLKWPLGVKWLSNGTTFCCIELVACIWYFLGAFTYLRKRAHYVRHFRSSVRPSVCLCVRMYLCCSHLKDFCKI